MVIWASLPSNYDNVYVNEKIGWLFFWKTIGLNVWMLVFCASYIWTSVLVILIEWTLANIIYQKVSIHYGNQGRTRLINVKPRSLTMRTISTTEFWVIQTPFSLFFGWGTVCSIADVIFFLHYDIDYHD